MNTVRAFLAIPVPPAYRDELHSIALTINNQNIRWTKPQNLHITLAFLGNIETEAIEMLGTWLCNFDWSQSVKLKCKYIAPFPDSNSKLCAVYLSKNHELQTLRNKVVNRLDMLGIAYDKKPFLPHITIGRCNMKVEQSMQYPTKLSFHAKSIVLYKSEMNHRGSVYTPLYTHII